MRNGSLRRKGSRSVPSRPDPTERGSLGRACQYRKGSSLERKHRTEARYHVDRGSRGSRILNGLGSSGVSAGEAHSFLPIPKMGFGVSVFDHFLVLQRCV